MRRVLLLGSPNSGKSSLFNRLTGLSQRVANYPGITVDVASGPMVSLPDTELVDFPGTYSLEPISGEEAIAVSFLNEALADDNVSHVLCVADATRLEKCLHFILQVIRECQLHQKPVTILANMSDVIRDNQLHFDPIGLSEALGVQVISVSARESQGFESLVECLGVDAALNLHADRNWRETPNEILRGTAQQLAEKFSPKGDVLINSQLRLDRFFLSTALGGLAFFAIMFLFFQSIFTWSAPIMDAVESVVSGLGQAVVPLIPNKVIADFVADALFGGVGAFLVFVPQIFVLTLVIGIMEDSGYLARAALICHRPLRVFGLTGKSFIPLLSGVACAIPAIYAARSVDSPRQRMMTYLAIPLMPCSARLPVYALLIATFIPSDTALFGLIGWQGMALFAIYFFGMLVALLVTGFVSKASKNKQPEQPFVLELPPYRLPTAKPLLRNAWNRCQQFVTQAGKIILAVTMVVWVLGYFPNGGADLGQSWLGTLGHFVEPVFAPLGLDWRYGIAILTSFLAREVFVGTLGTIFGIEGSEENMLPLVDHIQASGLPLGSGIALLVFFAVALQCVSTVVILAREGSSRLALTMLVSYLVGAYLLSLLVFQIVSVLL
ncbi:Ferrous iron transport protein B:Small GTP-binding protein domain [marine gamma proteobacterium HTCC2080]|nr:Ferrous iron transport protein B:Small GTP-binding protein domain [marine gamma proteobacterium HTCC2080]